MVLPPAMLKTIDIVLTVQRSSLRLDIPVRFVSSVLASTYSEIIEVRSFYFNLFSAFHIVAVAPFYLKHKSD
jgi:hypothetical protein